jgi:hypothetical protein
MEEEIHVQEEEKAEEERIEKALLASKATLGWIAFGANPTFSLNLLIFGAENVHFN